jgi:hypothetical protein
MFLAENRHIWLMILINPDQGKLAGAKSKKSPAELSSGRALRKRPSIGSPSGRNYSLTLPRQSVLNRIDLILNTMLESVAAA